MRDEVDWEVVEARIREIHDAVSGLRELMERGFESLSIHERFSMRYLVIQLVESAAGLGIRVLSTVFDEKAEAYPQCFIRLGERGAISPDLARRLAAAARLRNLLVHRYWEIDDHKVYGSVKEGLEDFQEFVKQVRNLMEDNDQEG